MKVPAVRNDRCSGGQSYAAAFESVLSLSDAARALRILRKLRDHGLTSFHLTGRLALETHRVLRREVTTRSVLNDIDFVVEGFHAVPQTLAAAFLAVHIHPKARPGKLVLQLVDPEERLRIDFFAPYGLTLARSGRLPNDAMRLISIEDLAARAAQTCLGLARGEEIDRKHADDFHVLAGWADPAAVEPAWRDHRLEGDPGLFSDACARVRDLLQTRADLLRVTAYSQDVEAGCPKCAETGAWRLAPKPLVVSLLGYC